MNSFVRLLGSSFSVLLLLVLAQPIYGSIAPQDESTSLPHPTTALQPGEVVKIVIDALAKNDYPFPDAGIQTTFNFASPLNKANTGPLERFILLVKGPTFGQMINHRYSMLSETVIEGENALQMVQIVSAKNETLYFAFRLRLQSEGEYEGMWLTEAVWPIEGRRDDLVVL